jgi:hypothetical protein
VRTWWWVTVEDGHAGRPLLVTFHSLGERGMARCEVPVRNLPLDLARTRLVAREHFDTGTTTLSLERLRGTR